MNDYEKYVQAVKNLGDSYLRNDELDINLFNKLCLNDLADDPRVLKVLNCLNEICCSSHSDELDPVLQLEISLSDLEGHLSNNHFSRT